MGLTLSDICQYVKGKIDVAALNEENYISTENMTPDKGGVTRASSLPSVSQTQAFFEGDVLVSNIRPYFKKIWLANLNGGCSNDVLVFRAKGDVCQKFLYYVLANDAFFEYSTATSKGTKMPRGDKVAIMKFEVPDFTYENQKKIVEILDAIDRKIRVNVAINENLALQAQAIYNRHFDSNTYSPTGILSDICCFSTNKTTIADLTTFTYFSTENILSNKAGAIEATNLPSVSTVTKCRKGDVLVSNIRPYFKKIIYVTEDCGCSADVLCFTPKKSEYSAFLFETLFADRFFDYMVAGSKGTKMPRGDKQQIMTYPVIIPTKESLSYFNPTIVPMLSLIESNRAEIFRLTSLRDALLPKLMSGELDVSEVDL